MLNDLETCVYDCVLHPFASFSPLEQFVVLHIYILFRCSISQSTRAESSPSASLLWCKCSTESLCALTLCALHQLNPTNPFVMLPADESIAIVELVVYPLVLIAILFVLVRHGLKAQAGFIFLASFTIVRIIGASFRIAATKNPTESNLTWAAILQSLGLGPLLMSTSSLLKRV